MLSLGTSFSGCFTFRQESANGSTSVADATCLVSLPLQFDFRESPGSLFLLTSHWRGLHLNKHVRQRQEHHTQVNFKVSPYGVVPQWQRAQRFFTIQMSPRFGKCAWCYCGYNRAKSTDKPRHMATVSDKLNYNSRLGNRQTWPGNTISNN